MEKILKAKVVYLLVLSIPLFLTFCKKSLQSPDRIKGVYVDTNLERIDLNDKKWDDAYETVVKLETQGIAAPKLTEPGIKEIRVKALHNGKWVAFFLSWDDPTKDLVAQLGHFSDGAALQFPATQGELPDYAMGGPPDAAKPVVIHQWKSVWQEASLGHLKGIKSFYPNTWSDLYIFEQVKEGAKDEMGKDEGISDLLKNFENSDNEHHVVLGAAGVCSPYESEYVGDKLGGKGLVMADIAGFYRAFHFPMELEFKDPVDNISVELSFLSYLTLKEAYAFFRGNKEEMQVCTDAKEKFQREHLFQWIEQFIEKLNEVVPDLFYGKISRVMKKYFEKGVLSSPLNDPC